MENDVHITRAEEWMDSEDHPIPIRDWLVYVNQDPEFRLDSSGKKASPEGSTVRYENLGHAVWTAWSKHEIDGNLAEFDFEDGRITVKNPDEEILGKMKKVAQALQANVQGDDGKRYD